MGRGEMAYVSAQVEDGYGTVIVEIRRGDTVLKHAESTGEYSIADAGVTIH
jgi:hypothetical protein